MPTFANRESLSSVRAKINNAIERVANAEVSATSAAISAMEAAASASTATTQATNASASASTATTQATNASASATIAQTYGGLPFTSRADAIAATIPAEITAIMVLHGGVWCKYVYNAAGTALTTAGGRNWSPVAPVYLEHFGAVGDGVADDTAKVTAALQGPHNVIYARDGANYRFTPVTGLNAALLAIVCEGKATFTTVVSTPGAIGLSVSNRQYFRVANIKFKSSGTKADGNATVGLKFEAGCSLIEVDEGCEFLDYSARGLQILQCVHASIKRPKVNTGGYGISLEQSGGIGCSAVVIDHPYIFDGTRGISSHGTTALTLVQPVFETCGATGTTDGALHAIGGRITLIDPYWESCNRDFVTSDCTVQWIGAPFKSGALAADSHTFSDLAFSERGFAKITPTDLTIRRIRPDTITNNDLVIGTNLTAPVAGGSVNWGGDTMETIKGSVVSATWTTVKALAGQSGDGAARVAYRYAIYAGQADLTTGYDTGRILNGVIYSDSGTTPTWLRIYLGNLQIQITNTSYGLGYGLVLQTTGAIGILP